MSRIQQVFRLPTLEVFEAHHTWLADCAKLGYTEKALVSQVIDPYLRSIRRLGVHGFLDKFQTQDSQTSVLEYALSLVKEDGTTLGLEDAIAREGFHAFWEAITKVFVTYAPQLYTELGEIERPRLAVNRILGGDVLIALLSQPVVTEYI